MGEEHGGRERPGGVPLVLDGAIGTELDRRGVDTGLPLWSARALIDRPEEVLRIHREYVASGADIITANTFRTTRRTFLRAGLPDRSEELTRLAVRLAQQAAGERRDPGRPVRIAGSLGPLEDCYHPELVPAERELEEEHALHARTLAAAGADLLLCEAMGTVREAAAACRACVSTGKETVVSFLCDTGGRLYGGETLREAAAACAPFGPSAFALNCVPARFMEKVILMLKAATELPFGVYANAGVPGEEATGREMACDVDAREYALLARRWAELGAAFIGGCCGTTPEHIRLLAEALRPQQAAGKPGGPARQRGGRDAS
jgi:S-methylmethionine-dependent homocysteine/selenocysteine methylase